MQSSDIAYIYYLVLRSLPAVCMIVPSGRTTSRLSTFSLIVPYLTALVPEALVADIPHKLASAPGSIKELMY